MASESWAQRSPYLLASLLALGCNAAENKVDEGDPIPDSNIVSCGDALLGHAAPAGSFDPSLTVDASGTTFAGSIIWQASCPGTETDTAAQIEFVVTELKIYDDDAGFPGEELGSTPISLGAVLTCKGAAAGVYEQEALDPISVTDLSAQCEAFQAMPTGMPLFAQVELIGEATTCSNETTPVLFRRQVGVQCPDP